MSSNYYTKSQKPQSNFDWFCSTFLHIETIFVIIFIIVVIYFLCYGKKFKFTEKPVDVHFNSNKKKTKKAEKRVNYMEEKCREIFEKIFKSPFPSMRPDWLKNPVTQKNLELDGYNPTIKTPMGHGLAFEYDGIQHSKYSPHFHKGNQWNYLYQLKKDTWKDKKCEERKIILIRIPYFVPEEELQSHIIDKLKRKNVL
jgi:hypothetical protein